MSRAAGVLASAPLDSAGGPAAGYNLDPLIDQLLDALADRVAERLRRHGALSTDRWLSAREAAEHLAVHPDTLRKHAAARRIPFEQDGRGCNLYFRLTDLDAWRASGGKLSGTTSHASMPLPGGLKAS